MRILLFVIQQLGTKLESNHFDWYTSSIFQSKSNRFLFNYLIFINLHGRSKTGLLNPDFPFSWIEQNASTSVKNLKHYKRLRRPKRLTTSLKVVKKISWPFSNQKTRWWKRLDLCPSSRMKSKLNQLVRETIIFLLWQQPMLTSINISKMISR